jgi:hypothetical protein
MSGNEIIRRVDCGNCPRVLGCYGQCESERVPDTRTMPLQLSAPVQERAPSATTLCTPTAEAMHEARAAVVAALAFARSLEVIVTVERESLLPLAMGTARYVVDVRPARKEIP